MLGPSGSGKTTTLRMIAGFELPTGGPDPAPRRGRHAAAAVRARRQHGLPGLRPVPAHDRRRQRRLRPDDPQGRPRPSARRRVAEALRMVRLEGYEERKPAQLSGGQRQRVALARALVNRPRVLLLDEPLGALDLKLREEMQIELKAIQQQVGITFIYVTHDQEEALTMSDRLAVFNRGRIEQVGAPAEVYERPATRVRGRLRGHVQPARRGEVAERDRRASRARSPSGPRRSASPTPDDAVADGRGQRRRARSATSSTSARTRATSWRSTRAPSWSSPQQNLATSRWRRSPQQGKAVRLIWKRQHCLPVADGRDRHRRRKHGRMMHRAGSSALAAVGGARSSPACGGGTRRLRRRPSLADASSAPTAGPDDQRPRLGGLRRGRLDRSRRTTGSPFEKETGCEVNVQIVRDVGRGVHACSRTNPEQFDVISASGDASLRLVARRLRPAGQRRPRAQLRRTSSRPQEQAVQHGRRRPLRHPARPRRQPADVAHGRRSRPGARRAGPTMFDPASRTRARSRSTTRRSTSPTRRSYLMTTKPELEASPTRTRSTRPSSRRPSTCSSSRSRSSASTGPTTSSRSTRSAAATSTVGTTWQVIANLLQAEDPPVPVEVVKPEEGATGWSDTWMINSKTKHLELRLRVHRPHRLARDERRRSPSTSARRRPTPRRAR